MKRPLSAFLCVLGVLSTIHPASAAHKQVPTVRLESTATVAAPPAKVWTYLTSGKNLVTWCPVWKSETNAKIMITKIGDVLDFTDQWGGGGRSIVTFLNPNKEIRIAHEPADGSYMCQAKIILTPEGAGTRIVYHEQYTDESDAVEATATQMEGEMGKTLAALKAGVEKK